MSVTKEQVESALKQYIDPYLEKDPVTAGVVKDIAIEGGDVKVKIVLGYPALTLTFQGRQANPKEVAVLWWQKFKFQ